MSLWSVFVCIFFCQVLPCVIRLYALRLILSSACRAQSVFEYKRSALYSGISLESTFSFMQFYTEIVGGLLILYDVKPVYSSCLLSAFI
jgi:hypothetical protein